MCGEGVLHREGHRAHVAGTVRPLRHHASLGVEHRDREVLPHARLLGVRGLVHGGPDLDGDRLQRPPDHPEGDRIDAPSHEMSSRTGSSGVPTFASVTMRLAYASTVAVAPGGSTD